MNTFQIKSKRDLAHDLLTGVVIALLSVPLSMGYAQVAGLPAQYGLYGSLFPVLVFGILTSSPRFAFGVDAAPAALVGTLITELGVISGSAEAVAVMPAITLLTALWLLIFWALRGGRFAKYVSELVLSGCVSGIASVVILAQLPRLFGGTAISGRAPVLLRHLFLELPHFNPISFAIGAGTVIVILLFRKHAKSSISVIMMVVGILLTILFHIDRWGVELLRPIPSGLPYITGVDFTFFEGHIENILIHTLAIALVISAETLVSTREIGRRYEDRINNQRELLAYFFSNSVAALFSSSPVSGSISRTDRAVKREVKSQWMCISGFSTMALILLFGTPLLSFLPVPILTGVVVASLISMMDFSMAIRLWKIDRWKLFVFMAAFSAELLGLAEGVIVGVILSFASFTVRSSSQPGIFLGCLEGKEGFYDLERTPRARPIQNAILYQFSGKLFLRISMTLRIAFERNCGKTLV